MSDDAFDGQILSEKLSKLNNSQQSIESLSRWCVSHRKKAKQIVETWDKLFNSAQKEQRVSFLYLANDILQNSRRNGHEFVNEFWKVLPSSLKHVYGAGDENRKKAVMRLVDIWEERKVFGSRGQRLKSDLLGKDPPPLAVSNGKSSNSIKILKKDSQSVRVRLVIGDLPEKIITAFQPLYDEDLNEETALNKCTAAVYHVGRIEEDLVHNSSTGNQQESGMIDNLQEQENVLQQCVGQLENAEASRDALVSLLKEALQDQESKLDLVRSQLQVARGHIEQASNIRRRLASPSFLTPPTTTTNSTTEVTRMLDQNVPSAQPNSTPLSQPVVSFAPLKTNDEESKKAAAAAVVAKLAASTSSAQMLTSVLSSLVAEEAASMNSGFKSGGFTTGFTSMFTPEKRAKHEHPTPVSDSGSSDMSNSAYYNSLQQQQQMNSSGLSPSTPMQQQPMSQANQMQAQFSQPPQPQQAMGSQANNPPANQFSQSGPMMMMPYGYAANTLPPPPPLPPHITMGLTRPTQPPQQQQQQPASGGYYRPPGLGFYGQGHQPTPPPPVPRQ